MDTDRIKGAAQEAGGRIQQGFGRLTGDTSTQAEGVAREIGGKTQGAFGEAKDQVRDFADDVSGYANDAVAHGGAYARDGMKAVAQTVEKYPLVYLFAAAGVGFVASMLLNEFSDRRYYRR